MEFAKKKGRHLTRKVCGKRLPIIPKYNVDKFLTWYHNKVGHLGRTKLVEEIQEQFYFVHLRKKILYRFRVCCSKCHEVEQRVNPENKPPRIMRKPRPPKAPEVDKRNPPKPKAVPTKKKSADSSTEDGKPPPSHPEQEEQVEDKKVDTV